MTSGDDKGGNEPQGPSGAEIPAVDINDADPAHGLSCADPAATNTQPRLAGAPTLFPVAARDATLAGSEDFPSGGGELGALMRAKDSSATPLGPTRGWPQSLRTCVSTCLSCSFPIAICWGPDFLLLYNAAYAEILADKRTTALGLPCAEVWPEIWDTIGPMLERAREQGKAVPADDLLLTMNRRCYSEECYFSFSYGPVRDETGGVGGIYCPVIGTTKRVIWQSARRAPWQP